MRKQDKELVLLILFLIWIISVILMVLIITISEEERVEEKLNYHYNNNYIYTDTSYTGILLGDGNLKGSIGTMWISFVDNGFSICKNYTGFEWEEVDYINCYNLKKELEESK